MKSKINFEKYLIDHSSSFLHAIKKLNSNKKKILIVTKSNKLVGTITDGDLRRALLAKNSLSSNLKNVFNSKPYFELRTKNYKNIIKKLIHKKLTFCPLVDNKKKIVDIFFLDNQVDPSKHHVVIMAGGKGKRLRPLTNKIPKPMLKINNKPMLQYVVNNFKMHGFKKFILSVNYLSSLIKKYFKDGSSQNIDIKYIREKKFLGTAGSLFYIKKLVDEPFIITNADVLTKLNYTAMLDYYYKTNSDLLICIKEDKIKIPYGTIELENLNFSNIVEKPEKKFYFNAGVYIANKQIFKYIKEDKKIDMPEIIDKLKIAKKFKISAFPILEKWDDLGDLTTLKNYKIKK